MKNPSTQKNPIDLYIRIVLLSILLFVSFLIVKPFLMILMWAALVAVALYPYYEKIVNMFKGKKKGMITSLFIIILLALIITPTINLTSSVVTSAVEFKEGYEAGTLKVPPPSQSVKEWPVIGEKTYNLWSQASYNIEGFLVKYKGEVGGVLNKVFGSLTGLMGTVFLALFSLIFAGVFMFSADGGYSTSVLFANRLMEGKGVELIDMIVSTIRSVVKGILVVSIIQAFLAYIGFLVIGLPGAAIFALLVLVFAIMQLPPVLPMIPAIAIIFSTTDSTTSAIIFAIYCILVGMSDSAMKPFFLGKGLQTPMMVILIGALGGMISMGMLGLFLGPVILAIAFQLYNTWVAEVEVPKEVAKSVVEETVKK